MTARRILAAAAAVIGWVALDLQLAALQSNAAARGIPFVTATVNYFSYFTILSNILAALVLSAFALDRGGFLTRPATSAAAALYMAVTGAIYFAILRHIWSPQGLDWLADTLLHYVMPVVYVLFWLVLAPKTGIGLRHVALWLIFPVLYAGYSLVRGTLTGFYPYPFIDAGALGYAAVLRNAAVLALAFAALAAALVGVTRIGRRN